MGTVPFFAAAIQGAPLVGLGQQEKNDVLVFFGDNADVANLLLGDIASKPDHVATVPAVASWWGMIPSLQPWANGVRG